MKFLFDVNMPPVLGQILGDAGHTFRCVVDLMPATSTDRAICEMALQNDETVITHDTDFGTLLAFSGHNKPSVILFRIYRVSATTFANLILQNWPVIEFPLSKGALVAFEEDKIRIRTLPIVR